MNKAPVSYNYIEDYLNKIRSKGGFFFTYHELIQAFGVTPEAIDQALHRLKSRNFIAQVKKGYYVILTPVYSAQGMLPPNLFIDDLMKSLGKQYYIGLLSAAALYGASHQQPLEYFVVTERPSIRSIKKGKLVINFLIKKEWPVNSIMKNKSEAGYINVSSPELTALDLFYYSNVISSNRAFTILQELQEEMKPTDLGKIAFDYPQTSAIQRLGYILEKKLNKVKLAAPLYKAISARKSYYVPLSPAKNKKGATDSRWKIIINTEMEGDL